METKLDNTTKPQHDAKLPVMRCFMIAYSFDNYGCYTVERFYGKDKDDCRENFWKDRPTANQIHCMEERF
jgi:hypothetical protein